MADLPPLMHPTQVAHPFHTKGLVYEEKYDGWRMLAVHARRQGSGRRTPDQPQRPTYTHLIPRDGYRAVDGLDTSPDPHESASLTQADTLTPRVTEGSVYHLAR